MKTEKVPINKNVDETDLKEIENSLLTVHELIVQKNKEIAELDNGSFNKMTHFIHVVSNRASSFIRSFLTLSNINNYQTAICIIRLQLDNCLRLYAYAIAEDSATFYNRVLEGIPIKDMEDREGNKMYDGYLKEKLNKLIPGLKQLYDNTSGFVHFSDKHLLMSTKVTPIDNETLSLTNGIGVNDELEIYQKVDYAYNMFCASNWYFKLVESYFQDLKETEKDN